MGELNFDVYPVSSLIEVKSVNQYTCAVDKLDYFVKEGYKELEKLHLTTLSSVFLESELVGMYALSTSDSTDSFSDINRYRIFGRASMHRSVPVVKIDHLSVNKPYQHDNITEHSRIGSSILKHIFRILLNIGTEYGVAFAGVVVDSIPDAIDFYLKNGFRYVNLQEENALDQDTYKLAISYDDMLKAYD